MTEKIDWCLHLDIGHIKLGMIACYHCRWKCSRAKEAGGAEQTAEGGQIGGVIAEYGDDDSEDECE